MTDFKAIVTSYKQANVQYKTFKCGDIQLVLTPYIDYTMVMTFYEYSEMLYIELEHMPLNEIVTKLVNRGWEVCA